MEFMELRGCGGISKILTLHVLPGSAFTESMMNVASFVTAEDSRTATATIVARTMKILADIFIRIRLDVVSVRGPTTADRILKASTQVSTVNGTY